MKLLDHTEHQGEDEIAAYMAVLRYYLGRDGVVTPSVSECPAARRLVELGEARWKTTLTLEAVK